MPNPALYVRFECGQEDRFSREYGPFPFVQITYDWLRVGPDGDGLANFVPSGDWIPEAEPTTTYSDVVVYSKETIDA